MTPSEALIVRTMESELEEGYDAGTALVRASNTLGLDRKRILQVWIQSLAAKDLT